MGNILDKAGLKTFATRVKTAIANAVAEVKLYFTTQKVTWSELKALRDAKKLVAGKTYRITDFVTTTAQADTRSAGHAFDILVVADDAGTLNKNARAVLHSGDTYFAQSDLSAWRLMYCLDNDDTRFAWADTENGKGVIFRMIDEWENDVPYDFKNIQFKRYKVTQTDERYDGVFTDGYYGVSQGFNGVEVSATDSIWAYTFSVLDVDRDSAEIKWDEDLQDASVHQGASNDPDGGGYLHPILHCEKNSLQSTNIAEIVDDSETTVKQTLNNGVFYSLYHWFEEDDVVRHELEHCAFNEFGNSYDFTLSVCSGNKTGVACYGFLCGNNCSSWTCGNDCYYWTCGNNCSSWTCGNYCHSWTCGNYCNSWTCGNNCYYWTCGNYCNSWTCGNFVNDVSIPQNNVSYFHLASGTRYVNIRSNGTPTGSTPLQNFEVKGGIVGDSDSSRVDIVIPTTDFPLGAQYTWTIAKNSKGEIKQYCEADLIN